MPYRTVSREIQPERVLRHKGVTVYRAYNDNDADDPLDYYFTLSGEIEPNNVFDIRTLKAWTAEPDLPCVFKEFPPALRRVAAQRWKAFEELGGTAAHCKAVLCRAILSGELKRP